MNKKHTTQIFDRAFFKFILVGIINTIVGMLIIFSLYNLASFNYWLSSAIGFALTSILSFFLNKNFTFSAKNYSVKMVVTFSLTIAISYLIAYGIAKPLMHYILSPYSQKFRDNTALFVGMCIFTGFNYIGQRCVVFKRND